MTFIHEYLYVWVDEDLITKLNIKFILSLTFKIKISLFPSIILDKMICNSKETEYVS